MTTIQLQHKKLREAAEQYDGLAIEVRALTKTYPGGVEAVKAIDFDVGRGEVFGLLGPNGAGKSTTIGMLTTTLSPTSGTALLAGLDVAREPVAARQMSSVVFQDAVVDRSFTGRRNLTLHARLWGVAAGEAAARIAEIGAAFDIAGILDRPVSSYSGGQRRRLEIARALVSDPQVLFLDEPTVGLDPRIRHELLDVIAGLRGRSEMTILLTTHYLDEAQRLCDRVAIMNRGEIAALDAPGALLAGLGGEVLEMRLDGDAAAALAALAAHGIATADVFTVGSTVTLPLRRTSAAEAIAAIHATDVRASGITTRTPTLDDVYLRLTGDRMAEAA
jgi:ABC-2 type transport system ATP-binding protein